MSFVGRSVETCIDNPPIAEAPLMHRYNITCKEPSTTKEVSLTALDTPVSNVLNCVSSILVYQTAPPEETLLRAAYQLVKRHPVLAGRYRTDGKHLSIDLSNAGMPLTIAHWQDGSLDAIPDALCFSSWWTALPAKAPLPSFIDDMDSFGTVFGGEPLFKLRLTTLGDGGGLLSFTAHHCLVGGAGVGYLQHHLTRACKGEVLEPLAADLRRDLLRREALAELLPEYADILKPGAAAADYALDMYPEESFKERWERLFGRSIAEMPPPFERTRAQLYSFGCIEIPQQDLTSLQELLARLTKQRLSKNDILMGFVWVLRCVLTRDPLPGQAGSERDYGMTSIDLGVNNLKVSLGDYIGNTAAACRIELPASAILKHSCSALDYSKQALVQAVGLVAAANRRTLQEWRRGGDNFKALLRRIAVPDSTCLLAAERAAMDELSAAGRQLRCIVTNLAVFGGGRRAALALLDCGQGPPKQSFLHCNPARERWAGIMPSGDGDGVVIEAMLPADAGQSVTRLLESLVPRARLRGCTAGGAGQGVSKI